jgi:hypothetical protein
VCGSVAPASRAAGDAAIGGSQRYHRWEVVLQIRGVNAARTSDGDANQYRCAADGVASEVLVELLLLHWGRWCDGL